MSTNLFICLAGWGGWGGQGGYAGGYGAGYAYGGDGKSFIL